MAGLFCGIGGLSDGGEGSGGGGAGGGLGCGGGAHTGNAPSSGWCDHGTTPQRPLPAMPRLLMLDRTEREGLIGPLSALFATDNSVRCVSAVKVGGMLPVKKLFCRFLAQGDARGAVSPAASQANTKGDGTHRFISAVAPDSELGIVPVSAFDITDRDVSTLRRANTSGSWPDRLFP